MQILVTSDLHYNIKRSQAPARKAADEILQTPADALVLVGDTAGADLEHHARALDLFENFAGRKFIVPGNHCLWCESGQTAIERYEKLLPALALEHGFEVLDHNPVVIDGVGLIGSIGWYDYSMRDAELGIALDFYREKISPGAAEYYGDHPHLFEKHRKSITPRQLEIGARWMDNWRMKLEISDEEFLEMLLVKLRAQLGELSQVASQIVAFVHHLPFDELLPDSEIPDRFKFAKAFLGSGKIGKLLLEYPAVSHVYCGHSHWPISAKVGHISAINNGSTYIEKKVNLLKIPAV